MDEHTSPIDDDELFVAQYLARSRTAPPPTPPPAPAPPPATEAVPAADGPDLHTRHGRAGISPQEAARRRELDLRRRTDWALGHGRITAATGDLKHRLVELRREALDAIAALDVDLCHLLTRRRELADRVLAAERALDGEFARSRGKHHVEPADLEPVTPTPRERLRGADLRRRLLDLLAATGQPMSVAELHRLLSLEGVAVVGRPSVAISNALAVEVRAGHAQKLGRGVYQIAAAVTA